VGLSKPRPQSRGLKTTLTEGLRGEENISDLCRREGIAASMYYGWSKELEPPANPAWFKGS
jgi:transposase-like protein